MIKIDLKLRVKRCIIYAILYLLVVKPFVISTSTPFIATPVEDHILLTPCEFQQEEKFL